VDLTTFLFLLPLPVALLALACERVRALAARSPVAASLVLPACWLLHAARAGAVDVFPFALVVALAVGTVLALSSVAAGEPRLTLTDLIVSVALFLPLDLRWSYLLWPPGVDGAYHFWAIGLTYLAALGWGVAPRALFALGHRPPNLRDLRVGVAALLAFATISIPVGLATGFVAKPNVAHFEWQKALFEALGLVLGVALPEELFFRGILDNGLQARFGPFVSLAVSSLAFGAMHWPRRSSLRETLIYIALASVAGVFYALAYRKGRGLPAAVICHALVDWIWIEFLRK
jgi:membrane protease YdiL (CAAX protease family)